MQDDRWECSVDAISKADWHALVSTFNDGNLFQTWSYAASRWGEEDTSHLVLKRNGVPVGAAQVRIMRIPLLRRPICAFVMNGPLWRPSDASGSLDTLARLYRELRREYVDRRGLYLRVMSWDIDRDDENCKASIVAENFRWQPSSHETFLIDLNLSAEELQLAMRKSTRTRLRKSLRAGLEVVRGTDRAMYEESMVAYDEMKKRKNFMDTTDVVALGCVQEDLPPNLKLVNLVARHEGETIASLIGSAIGDTCFYLVGGTGDKGLKLNALLLLIWEAMMIAKEGGSKYFDLGGGDKVRNYGVYDWKLGIAGKDAFEGSYLGLFDAWNSNTNRIATVGGEKIREMARAVFRRLRRLFKQR